jgi:addiction module RelE/StbE family toxin
VKIRWSKGAKADLLRIFGYIAQDDPAAARRMKERMQAAVRRLREHPAIGRVVPEFGDPDVRERIVPPYRIIYLVRGEITILAIYHGRQLLTDESGEQ